MPTSRSEPPGAVPTTPITHTDRPPAPPARRAELPRDPPPSAHRRSPRGGLVLLALAAILPMLALGTAPRRAEADRGGTGPPARAPGVALGREAAASVAALADPGGSTGARGGARLWTVEFAERDPSVPTAPARPSAPSTDGSRGEADAAVEAPRAFVDAPLGRALLWAGTIVAALLVGALAAVVLVDRTRARALAELAAGARALVRGRSPPAIARGPRAVVAAGEALRAAAEAIARREAVEVDTRERLTLALQAGALGTWDLDLVEGRRLLSPRSAAIYGVPAEALYARDVWQSVIEPRDRARIEAAFAGLLERGEAYDVEFRVRAQDGSIRWVGSQALVKRDSATGAPLRVVGIHRDVTDRKREAEQRELLVHELNHRVKNTLATIQSIARSSFRDATSVAGARDAFEARLLALSAAHDVLTRESWDGAELASIAAVVTAPYRPGPVGPVDDDAPGAARAAQDADAGTARIAASGPSLRLDPQRALALAMALHELCTNAVKHGALSDGYGRVAIAWTLPTTPTGRRLRLRWTETDGPPITARPSRSGFGSRLLERGLSRELAGEVRIDYPPTGLVCLIDVPLPARDAAGPRRPAGAAAETDPGPRRTGAEARG